METSIVVDDSRTTPAGRKPLSRSSSHSYPRVPAGADQTWPGARLATFGVSRQKRILPSASGTWKLSLRTPLTVKIVPVRAFSGRPPSAGGENRGSRQVPVHWGEGSILAPAWVSL